ncbi:hypothetical protein Dimus_014551 [Dionaea muscipula]
MNYVEEASGNGLAEATTILFPPTQVMGSSGRRPHAGYDRNRIPSSVFSNKPTTPLEWSIASSESLFSIIAAGNNSFSVADQLKQHSDIIATNFSGSGSGSAEPAPHEAAATVAPSAGSIKNGVEVRLHSFIALRHDDADDRQHADQIPASSSKTAFDSKDNGGAPKTKGNESPAPANYMINIAVDHQNTMTGISCSSGDAGYTSHAKLQASS